jgi:hypothetical protein
MKMTSKNIALAAALFCVSSVANSASITWVVDITLPTDPDIDGTPDPSVGVITGSFVLDTDTLLISDVNVSAVGTAFAAASASLVDVYGPYNSGARAFELLPVSPASDLTNVEDIYIKMDVPGLTIAGGVIDVTSVTTYLCLDSTCSDFDELYTSNLVSGTLSAIPVPAAVWLFGSALAGLGWLRRSPSVQTEP